MRQYVTSLLILTLSAHLYAEQLYINEIQSSNIDQIVDPSFNYGGWIEIYNAGTSAIDMTNWYLSDDPDNLMKARIPYSCSVAGKGYTALYFDHYDMYYAKKMVSMKLDCDGGTIYLSNASGILQASAEYPEAIARSSWCRTTDGGEQWAWTASPTLEATNNGATYCEERLEEPVIDTPSKLFSGTLTFHVEVPEGCTLMYTTNGSTPSIDNGSSTSSRNFTTSTTRTYRFCVVKEGYLSSKVISRTFIKNDKNFTLPIFTINSANENFYGNTLGIFVKGTNGRPGNGQSGKCNWNMDWERPASFEYFTPEGECVISQEVGIERCGGWSRAWNPCSFKIKANKVYEGEKHLNYQFFENKPYLRHKTLQIRNGGNDNGCRIKDPALQEIVSRSGLNIDCQAYQPAAHYINGTYKGVINVREPNNKHFVYANFGIDDDELDQFEMSPDSGYVQKCGNKEAFNEWYNLSKNCSSSDNYEKICALVDIEEFCNYMAVQLYLGNWDWPQNNYKAYHPTYEGGRFRFVLYDLDGSFSTNDPFNTFANKQTYTFDNLLGPVSGRYTKEIEVVTIFLNMLNNADFRKEFTDCYCLVAGSVFAPERCKAIVNELANRVSNMMDYSGEGPWNTANTVINQLSASRQSSMISKLKSYSKCKLSGKTPQNVTLSSDCPFAKLYVNGLPVPTNTFNGQLFSPITLTAQAPTGYLFVGWKEATLVNTTLLSKGSTWKYYDKGSLDGKAWKSENYDDRGWDTGKAPLGYYTGGGRNYSTILDYGSDENNKRPTYYFRCNLDINSDLSGNEIFTLDYVVDDGFVLYVNGQEACRYNINGTPSYNSYASSYAQGNPDEGSLVLDNSYFKKGSNLIAVELHNNSANSTDVYWDGAISMSKKDGSSIVCTTEDYTIPSTGSVSVVACYEREQELDEIHAPVVINEISANNDIHANEYWKKVDWVELYNTTDSEIDLAGLYFSDELDNPGKWAIEAPDGVDTKIAPHGFRIIWCDNKEGKSELHAPFKLANADSSCVMLSEPNGIWSHTFAYDKHSSRESVGCYPDGSDKKYVMNLTTPGQSNRFTQISSVSEAIPTNIEYVSWESSEKEFRVYDLNGILLQSGTDEINIKGLPSGIYIIKRGEERIKVVR